MKNFSQKTFRLGVKPIVKCLSLKLAWMGFAQAVGDV